MSEKVILQRLDEFDTKGSVNIIPNTKPAVLKRVLNSLVSGVYTVWVQASTRVFVEVLVKE